MTDRRLSFTLSEMSQYTPSVSEEDVERLLGRDYPQDSHDEIRSLFISVTVRERLRVIAACLKNAGGDLERLKTQLSTANGYWRETISEAEYPRVKKASRYTEAEIHDKQREQYLRWFEQ